MNDFEERQDKYLADMMKEITDSIVCSGEKLSKKYDLQGSEENCAYANFIGNMASIFLSKHLSMIPKEDRLQACKDITLHAVEDLKHYKEMQ